MADVPYRRVHVVINPASGKDEPILNTLNDVFRGHDIDWNVSITKKYGDATEQAKRAIADGVDLVVGYGGDGTQHEIANAVLVASDELGIKARMGILPGGTGNGFCREMGVPGKLREAAELLVSSTRTRAIDAGRIRSIADPQARDRYFIQRMYIGIEPEEQTSREQKDRYGVFAYAVNMAQRAGKATHVHYRAEVDDDIVEFDASKVYVVNSGMMGSGLQITHGYAVDDGKFDCFVLDSGTFDTYRAAAARFLALPTEHAQRYMRQASSVAIQTEPDQPVWTDGEYVGRTPVTVDVVPGALNVVVP